MQQTDIDGDYILCLNCGFSLSLDDNEPLRITPLVEEQASQIERLKMPDELKNKTLLKLKQRLLEEA